MWAINLPLAKLLTGLLLLHTTCTTSTAQKINIHEMQESQAQFHEREHASNTPFLSATLKTEITSVPTAITANQKALLSNSLVQFLQRVFDDQQVYDVGIVGVSIFEEQVLSAVEGDGGDNRRTMETTTHMRHTQKLNQKHHGRKLVLNTLQSGQFNFEKDDDEYNNEEEEDKDADDNEKEWDEIQTLVEKEGGYMLRFATVISAEHTRQQLLSHGDYQTMLIHICHKFENHLVEFVSGINDEYFENVKSVVVSGYETDMMDAKMKAAGGGDSSSSGSLEFQAEILDETYDDETPVTMLSEESSKLSAAAISGIVLGCLLLIPLVFAAVKFYRRENRLKVARWRTQEMSTANKSAEIKSLRVLYNKPNDDDYSFNPLGTDNGYNGESIPRFYSDNEDGYSRRQDEAVSFGNEQSSSFPTSSLSQQTSMDTSDMSPDDPSSTKASLFTVISHQDHQHVYAPPGKVGVAIDVVDGYPIVHKVKRGSPLEKSLKPNDIVMAIDDVDTTRMSAADVTQLMVKRMNYQRKITFVRKDND